ncbi:MAG: hypothetical protein AAGA35_04180, partial [Patescibacteria group bacterium]
MKHYLFLGLFLFPSVASAQTLFTLLAGINNLFNNFIIPFLITLAVLFFIYNVIRYFMIEAAESDGREKARRFMLWSILAFVIIVGFWGIVTFVSNAFGVTPTGTERQVDTYVTGDAPFGTGSNSGPQNFPNYGPPGTNNDSSIFTDLSDWLFGGGSETDFV